MVLMNLFTRQWRHRRGERICGHVGEGEGGVNWESSTEI